MCIKPLKVLILILATALSATAQHNMTPNPNRKKVGVLLYEHAIPMDYVPSMEIFRVCGQMNDFEVYTIGETESVTSMGGEKIPVRYNLQNAPRPDILIVGGGEWTSYNKSSELIKYIVSLHESGTIIYSICTGAYLLAKAGLLDNIESTSIHIQLDLLQKLAPKTKVVKREFVDTGSIVTAAGAATGIDASLALIGRVSGEEKAKWIAETYLDYKWWGR